MDKLEKITHREAELQRRFFKWHRRLTNPIIEWIKYKIDCVKLLIALAQDSRNNKGKEGEL